MSTNAKTGVFYIDFLADLEVSEYERKYLNGDLKNAGSDDVMDLDEPDWRIFKCPKRAHEFLARYIHVLHHELDNEKICVSRKLPGMLYKRRYIVQSLMGVKTYTTRSYRKNWKPGQLINLHDQKHFLTVRIERITEVDGGEFRYDFTIPTKGELYEEATKRA